MRQSRECPKTAKLCDELRRFNAKVIAIVAGEMQEPGLPDRIIWHPDWCGWIEFKDKAPLAPIQRRKIDELNARRAGSAYVVRFTDVWQNGSLQDSDGNVLATFTGARELLCILKETTLRLRSSS